MSGKTFWILIVILVLSLIALFVCINALKNIEAEQITLPEIKQYEPENSFEPYEEDNGNDNLLELFEEKNK